MEQEENILPENDAGEGRPSSLSPEEEREQELPVTPDQEDHSNTIELKPEVEIEEVFDYDNMVMASLPHDSFLRNGCEGVLSFLRQKEEYLYPPILHSPPEDRKIIHFMDISDDDRLFWFIGDIHGDITSLLTVFGYIEATASKTPGRKHTIIFLGDLIDRGAYSREVIDFVLFLMEERTDYDVLFIKGNHDSGLVKTEEGIFYSSVLPDDFAKELNNKRNDRDYPSDILGRTAERFFQDAPSAIVLHWDDQAVFCTHGGVPHDDVQEAWENSPLILDDISSDAILESRFEDDLVWTRLHPAALAKRPNRCSHGTQLGIRNFESFCDLFFKKTGLRIIMLLRGHDHEELGYKYYDQYKKQTVMTFNTMSASYTFPERKPCIAQWERGKDLKLIVLTTPDVFKTSHRQPEE